MIAWFEAFGTRVSNGSLKKAKRRASISPPQDHRDKLENILAVLNRARTPDEMNLPGFRLHPLKGDLKGCWSATVRANWRVTFRLDEEDAYDVDLIDYH